MCADPYFSAVNVGSRHIHGDHFFLLLLPPSGPLGAILSMPLAEPDHFFEILVRPDTGPIQVTYDATSAQRGFADSGGKPRLSFVASALRNHHRTIDNEARELENARADTFPRLSRTASLVRDPAQSSGAWFPLMHTKYSY